MILGFNEYINELLLEAKSPEEVARILSYKHQDVPESLIKKLVDTDPTKKKTYAAWVLDVEHDLAKIADYIKTGKLANIFKYFRENASEGASLTDKKSIEEAERYLPDYSDVLKKIGDEEADDFDIKFKSPEWIIAVPNTYEASKKLGQNTKWCTANAYGNGEHYYRQYTNGNHPLWVNFDLRKKETLKGVTYPYKRYQFSFESNAFLDAEDEPFNWEEIAMPEDVQEFYESQGYSVEKIQMSDEERWERYNDERYEHSEYLFGDIYLMPVWNEAMEWNDDEDIDYELYDVREDDTDSLYNTECYTRDSVIFKSSEYAILKEKYNKGRYTIVAATEDATESAYIYPRILNYKPIKQGVAFIDPNNGKLYCVINGYGEFSSLSEHTKSFNDDAEIFLNPKTGPADEIYIEVADNGMHSLYWLNEEEGELTQIIANDIPVNGKYFELNERGMIEGQYSTYSPTDNYENEEEGVYRPVSILANKNLVVGINSNTVFYDRYNIFHKGNMAEKILDEDFQVFVKDLSDTDYNAVVVKKGSKQSLWSIATGKRISGKYDYIQTNSEKTLILGAPETGDSGDRYIITGKGDIMTNGVYNAIQNDRVPIQMLDKDGVKRFRVFNMKTGQFEMEWVNKMSQLKYFTFASFYGRYIFASNSNDEVFFCNWAENKVIASGISLKPQPNVLLDFKTRRECPNLILISFIDGTQNLFHMPSGRFILGERPQNILGCKGKGEENNAFDGYALLEYPNKTIFARIDKNGKPEKILDINPRYKEIIPEVIGQGIVLDLMAEFNGHKEKELFKIDMGTGNIYIYGINPTTNVYEEIPLNQVPPEKQKLVADIFPTITSPAQSLAERMDRVRKKLHTW